MQTMSFQKSCFRNRKSRCCLIPNWTIRRSRLTKIRWTRTRDLQSSPNWTTMIRNSRSNLNSTMPTQKKLRSCYWAMKDWSWSKAQSPKLWLWFLAM